MPISFDRLPAKQLKAVLAIAPTELPEEDAVAVRDFVERIGGRENARLAVAMLEDIERGQDRR